MCSQELVGGAIKQSQELLTEQERVWGSITIAEVREDFSEL